MKKNILLFSLSIIWWQCREKPLLLEEWKGQTLQSSRLISIIDTTCDAFVFTPCQILNDSIVSFETYFFQEKGISLGVHPKSKIIKNITIDAYIEKCKCGRNIKHKNINKFIFPYNLQLTDNQDDIIEKLGRINDTEIMRTEFFSLYIFYAKNIKIGFFEDRIIYISI